jgi:3-methyl-2-oxobutanoate hydroxymethyltransferase
MKQKSIHFLQKKHDNNEKIVMLTAYDATSAGLCHRADVDCILVGDSLGMVIQGQEQTTHVTIDDMLYHVKNVVQGLKNSSLTHETATPFVMADMPFGSYATAEQAFHNAVKFIQAGAQMVKLEGGTWLIPIIEFLHKRGILVCGHIGFTPQTVHALGGYKVQGRTSEQQKELLQLATELTLAGSTMLLLEMTTTTATQIIWQQSSIPVIGIGCGVDVSGQVLVWHDVLGLTELIGGKSPKFSQAYHGFINEKTGILGAMHQYVCDVREQKFPQLQHGWD